MARTDAVTTLKKPVRRTARCHVPHGVKPVIVITLYPGGVIGLRESGRRQASEQQVEAGALYAQLVAKATRKRGAR